MRHQVLPRNQQDILQTAAPACRVVDGDEIASDAMSVAQRSTGIP